MKKGSYSHYLVLASFVILGACGQASTDAANGADTTSRGTDTTTDTTSSKRYCTDPINNSSTFLLNDFFKPLKGVSGLEGAPTFCHTISGSGTNVDAALMVEYEDKWGIRAVTFDSSSSTVVEGKLVMSGSSVSYETIFKDGMGLVKIVASGPSSTGILTGSIYYYNFPSYEEALNAAVHQAQLDCQNGTKTVYECMGYTYPTFWWNQPIYTSQGQQMKEMAIAIMNDSSKRKLLGNIRFDYTESNVP